MKKFGLLLLLLSITLFIPPSVYAKKKISRTLKQKVSNKTNIPNTPWTKLKLRVDKNAITMALGDLNLADQLDYTLTYTSADVDQGVSSSLDLEKSSQQKEILFGTCSGTNCTYHQDIKDMIFEIIIKLKSGQTLTRRYQINP